MEDPNDNLNPLIP
ncbi:unnamed protein product, partial [Allacma fusca]